MASFNQITLLGNVVRDLEPRAVGDSQVCDISLAVNDRVKKGSEWVDETTFIDCTCWGKTAEIACNYLTKGSPVLLAGRIKQDNWLDKASGEKRSKIKMVVDRLTLVGGKREDAQQAQPTRTTRTKQSSFEETAAAAFDGKVDEDIPF